MLDPWTASNYPHQSNDDDKPRKGKVVIFFKKATVLLITLGVVFLIAWGYATGINDLAFKYCAGEYKTPQCEKDRAETKRLGYEKAKTVREDQLRR